MEVRRKEREIASGDNILRIIRECRYRRIALADGRCSYIVPVNFGYDSVGNILYFHGAAEGRKMDLIHRNGYAGFEMDTAHELMRADVTYGFSFHYWNIAGEGGITVVEDPGEKQHGLNCIMKHISGTGTQEYPDAMLRRTTVMRLDVERLCAKVNE